MSMLKHESRPTDLTRIAKALAVGVIGAACYVGYVAATPPQKGYATLEPHRCYQCAGDLKPIVIQGVPAVKCKDCGFEFFPPVKISRLPATDQEDTSL